MALKFCFGSVVSDAEGVRGERLKLKVFCRAGKEDENGYFVAKPFGKKL